MIKWNLTRPEEMLFALLRASLHQKEVEMKHFQNVTNEDWTDCFRIASEQGVAALAWDALIKLPVALYPSLELKLKWGMVAKNCEKKHHRYCQTIHDLTAFYASYGIATLHLKGVGLSTLYPIPSHREGGDIDIYTYAANKNISDKEANALADTLMIEQGLDIDFKKTPKHSSFYYKGILVENHKTFLNVHSYPIAKQVEELLKERMNPQVVPLDTGKILIPSVEFNTLFVFFHAAQHLGSGFSIHHLYDWAVIIHRHGLHLPLELTDKRLLRVISAFTTLCNHLLGTSVDIKEEKEFAGRILKEMLHPAYYKRPLPKSKTGVVVYKIKRFIYNQKLKKSIFNHSPWKSLYVSIIHHLRHPQKIFH